MTTNNSFESFVFLGMALDPIHAGAGGTRLGRVDNTIVRDPATRIPKIPGSSLAGIMRAYTAMKNEKYPNCAGQKDHCGKADCPVCTVFGFAKGTEGGFAGLAAFSDMQVLLFPVASQQGPQWITSPMALYQSGIKELGELDDPHAVYRKEKTSSGMLNFGWLFLQAKDLQQIDSIVEEIKSKGVQSYITERLCIVSDKLFTHIVNSNLEVRTSVSINPKTGAAEDGALFTYEALPRGTVLSWEITCRNPKHFKIKDAEIKAVNSPDAVKEVVMGAHTYLEHLGIGGMGSRGMGRLRVLSSKEAK